MSAKLSRGPSWTEVILGAVLSVILGGLLGAAALVFRPIITKEPAKDADKVKDAVYYLEGSRDPTKGRQAPEKRKAFAAGQSVTVVEEELNTLVGPAPAAPAGKGAPAPAPKGGKAPEKAKEAEKAPESSVGGLFTVGAPNFRIRDGSMQIGVPVTITALDLGLKVIAQARGGIAKEGGGFVFDVKELYFGSCPVQRLPFVGSFVHDKFIAAQAIPDDIKASWGKLAGAKIEGNSLKLTMP